MSAELLESRRLLQKQQDAAKAPGQEQEAEIEAKLTATEGAEGEPKDGQGQGCGGCKEDGKGDKEAVAEEEKGGGEEGGGEGTAGYAEFLPVEWFSKVRGGWRGVFGVFCFFFQALAK